MTQTAPRRNCRKLGSNLEIYTVDSKKSLQSFAEDVRRGLTADPKRLPPRCLYDELGSVLFDAICLLPEYHLTRAETEILTRRSDEIAAALPSPLRLIELGSGSAGKTRHLIAALLRHQQELRYVPIDVSDTALESSSRQLLQEFPRLKVSGCLGDYFHVLDWLAEESLPLGPPPPTLILFLGSTLGNLERVAQHDLLRRARRLLRPGDGFLLGADIQSSEADLLLAYDDPLGITSAFNLNLLVRMNRELGADFEVSQFHHIAHFNRELNRIEAFLVSRRAQTIDIPRLSLEIPFEKDERIHTESSHKFTIKMLGQLATDTGFHLERTWCDEAGRFTETLLIAS